MIWSQGSSHNISNSTSTTVISNLLQGQRKPYAVFPANGTRLLHLGRAVVQSPEGSEPLGNNQNLPETLPEGCTQDMDPASQKVYYYNTTTGVSCWERPVDESKEKVVHVPQLDQVEDRLWKKRK
mmetsp:Transcript_23206/g.50241  ORF Transcript_23206/g.50241 Transcript_23206/m.50241 type:complete len:125 (-) Transcript_23206:187-561(-)